MSEEVQQARASEPSAPAPPPGTNNPYTRYGTFRRRWRLPEDLTPAQETVFLNMQLRKMNRALTGTKSRNRTYELGFLAVLLVIIYSVGAQKYGTEDEDTTVPLNEPFVSLTLGEVILIGVWLYLAVFISEMFKESKFIELLYWMFIYWPLLAMVLSLLFGEQASHQLTYLKYGHAMGIAFVLVELFTIAIFVCIYYAYPSMLNSDWFRQKRRVAAYWKVNVVADWTMTYKKHKTLHRKRYTCKYEGETNEKGEPHGLGRWYDEAFDGEVLTGTWKNGVPVAPFYSRRYGNGDTFNAVRIAYVMASDDDFVTTKFWPTNENAPTYGIASVECSVSGAFYNELPSATHFLGPAIFYAESSMGEMCRNLTHTTLESEFNMLQIKTSGGYGVSVKGHVHAETGKAFHDVDEILIRVKREIQATEAPMQFMPRQRRRTGVLEKIGVSETDVTQIECTGNIAEFTETDGLESGEVTNGKKISRKEQKLTLSVNDWTPTMHKEALVFIPGFNCCLKDALQNFGQLMAMTKLDSHVYPILYGWPCGQVLSYHSASRTSQNEQNCKNFLQLMQSLQHSGITNIHLMSHSMGVQTLLGAFCDQSDGTRSEVSMCFHLAPGQHDTTTPDKMTVEGTLEEENLLVCKTLTMLNPDFPLEAFVTHAFRSVRRVCDTITVVGDKNDQALFWSQFVNGIGVYFGYKQPCNLEPNNNNNAQLRYQLVIGKSIESLYLPDNLSQNRNLRSELLFQDRAPLVLCTSEEEDHEEKAWLDLDVIDTTGLDTNIADIRHSAYNLNPTLLNDLEELITTGQRAMKRSSLLYRDGNIFSYCHAPSYVSF